MIVSEERKQKIEHVVMHRQRGAMLVLEDIHDPHNIAAILRSCDAFGVQYVSLVYEQEKYVNPKRVGKSSSSSANKWLDFTVYRSTNECIQALKSQGYTIIATALAKNARPLGDIDFTHEPVALVIGNEHRGVSPYMLDAADDIAMIPMKGMVQSLNVSVTAAICLYELTRQRQESKKDFSFSQSDHTRLLEDFLHR